MSLRVSSLDLFCLHSHPVPNFMRRQRRDATGDIVSAAKGMDKLRLGINELVWWIDGTEARNIRQCVFGSNSYSQTDCSGVTYITYLYRRINGAKSVGEEKKVVREKDFLYVVVTTSQLSKS